MGQPLDHVGQPHERMVISFHHCSAPPKPFIALHTYVYLHALTHNDPQICGDRYTERHKLRIKIKTQSLENREDVCFVHGDLD